MNLAGTSHRSWRWATLLIVGGLTATTGCHRSFVMTGSWCFNWNWIRGGCTNCDSCRARIFPRHMSTYDCPTCGERGCTRQSCRAARTGCTACGGPFPRLGRAFGLGCYDPRVPHHVGKHYPSPYRPDVPMSPWSTDGPGSFHPVPTRPVYGPKPRPADVIPNSDEGPSDAGLESIPLRDMPRNLDTPSDPRNVIPPPEELESTPDDFPADTSSSLQKKYPVQQTGWRARKS